MVAPMGENHLHYGRGIHFEDAPLGGHHATETVFGSAALLHPGHPGEWGMLQVRSTPPAKEDTALVFGYEGKTPPGWY